MACRRSRPKRRICKRTSLIISHFAALLVAHQHRRAGRTALRRSALTKQGSPIDCTTHYDASESGVLWDTNGMFPLFVRKPRAVATYRHQSLNTAQGDVFRAGNFRPFLQARIFCTGCSFTPFLCICSMLLVVRAISDCRLTACIAYHILQIARDTSVTRLLLRFTNR